MVKTVLHEAGALMDTALVVAGWVAFVAGIALALYTHPIASGCLMAVARVLP